MNKGWVSIHREILESPLWIQGTYTQKLLMMVLVLRANASPKKWLFKGKKIVIERGQLITSLESLKNTLGKGIGIRQVRTALSNLEKYEFLTNQCTYTGRLITVLNYSKYQDIVKIDDKQNGKEVPKLCQSTDKELTTNNNINHTNHINHVTNNTYPPKEKEANDNSIEHKLANYLYQRIVKNNPNFKKPNLSNWAKHIDLMIKKDKRNPDDIRKVIDFAQEDDFWQANILSTEKLRKQFDQLLMKSSKEKGNKNDRGKKYIERSYGEDEWKYKERKFFEEKV